MIFNILLYSINNSHLPLYKFLSLSVITKHNMVYFSCHMSSVTTIKITVFMRRDLEGSTSNMNKNIRVVMPNLLMMPFRLLIPLGIHMLMMRLSTIQFIIVWWNGVEKINALVIVFDMMMRLVTWHCALYFLNRSNTCILLIWCLNIISNTFHVIDVSSESHNFVCLFRSTFFIYLIISDIVCFSLSP